MTTTEALLRHLASKPGHDEVKADFRQLLLAEFGADISDFDFERRVPEVRGRLDALVGRTVFEAKADLVHEWRDVEARMPDYLADREREEKERFIGIASDGLRWRAVELVSGQLQLIKEFVLDPERPGPFLAFLDSVLALKASLPPEPLTIQVELGIDSPAFRRAAESLAAIWQSMKDDPTISLKRQLWTQLLTLVYGRKIENDALWFQHTFLVIVAKSIAFAVTGLRDDDPARMLSGASFRDASIFGAVESDFFDWVLASPDGVNLVRRIVNHIRRFRLDQVESDVLKVLYESLIDRDQRHGLGEYYTPDWLAAKIVREVVTNPLEQRVLDPACGSGTFLFQAVRTFLAEAEEAGMAPEHRAATCAEHVAGLDIHPVAVIIARVTYLLALVQGNALTQRSGALVVPVYLGDSMQLSVRTIMKHRELTIDVPPGSEGETPIPVTLSFPDVFCRIPALFDKMLDAIRDGSERGLTRRQVEQNLTQLLNDHHARVRALETDPRGIDEEERQGIEDFGRTFVAFDALRRAGRDSVWAYVARNLSRPLFFSAYSGWASVLVGNPPWVAFRHMTRELQGRFRELARGERVYVGGRFATQNDLAALFTVRAAGLYLRPGGRLAFVLPMAALTRGQFEKLRIGSFYSAKLQWEAAWTMDKGVSPLFCVPSCVVFGRKRNTPRRLPDTVRAYTGQLPYRDAPEDIADTCLTVRDGAPALDRPAFVGGSAYREAFRQGATLVPRRLCLVERVPTGRLGGDPAKPLVVGRRGGLDKRPWRDLLPPESQVEARFLRPVLLGESIAPFRVIQPFEGVIPVDDGGVMDAKGAADRGWLALNNWMSRTETIWESHKRTELSLTGRWDYHGELLAQFPIAPLRVVYAKAGTQPAACLIRDERGVIDHKLYWTAPASEDEGHYLVAILGSEAARARIASLQSRGQFGARDFDKVMFNLPIPRFDPKSTLHAELSAASARAEAVADDVVIPEGTRFQRARRLIREALADDGVSGEIDRLVIRLLDVN